MSEYTGFYSFALRIDRYEKAMRDAMLLIQDGKAEEARLLLHDTLSRSGSFTGNLDKEITL